MKSFNKEKIIPYLPEILLGTAIGISFIGELIETSNVNYFVFFCGLILSTLIIWKNKFFALTISIVLGVLSLYMMFAVFSEYREFPPGDRGGLELLVVGEVIFLSLLLISILLPGKYLKVNKGV